MTDDYDDIEPTKEQKDIAIKDLRDTIMDAGYQGVDLIYAGVLVDIVEAICDACDRALEMWAGDEESFASSGSAIAVLTVLDTAFDALHLIGLEVDPELFNQED